MISNSRKEISCKVQQQFNTTMACFRTETLRKLSIRVIIKDKSIIIMTYSEGEQCQFAKPDAGEGIHDRYNPSSDYKFIWKYILTYHIDHVRSSLQALEKSQEQQHCGQRESTDSNHCNASPRLLAQESAPCKARGKAVCLWRQSLNPSSTPSTTLAQYLVLQTTLLAPGGQGPPGSPLQSSQLPPHFLQHKHSTVQPHSAAGHLGSVQLKSTQTLPRLLLDGLGHLGMHSGESG